MFGPGIERPPWDSENKYLPHKMKIYYEDMLNVSSSPKLVRDYRLYLVSYATILVTIVYFT